MPHNNPVREGVESGETVFIDPSALSELPSHLTQQDLETLVGLNINSSDLEALHVSADQQDSSGVLLSDRVGNIVEIENDSVAMDTSDSLVQETQSMEIDSLVDHTQSLNDLDMLHHGHEFLPITGHEELMESSHCDDDLSTKNFLSSSSQEVEPSVDQNTHHIVGGEPLATQILKTSSGQFVILQPNQNTIPLSGTIRGNSMSSTSQMFTSMANTNSSKPIFVSTNQQSIKHVTVNANQQPQFRTLQLKTPISLSQSQLGGNTTRPMTKVILSSQMGGGNLAQQLRLISTNNNNSNVNQSILPSSNKFALQLQSVGQNKNIVHSPIKTLGSRENFTKITSPQKIIITNKMKQPITSINSIASNFKPGQIISSAGAQLIKIPVSQLSQLSNASQLSQLSNNKLNFRIVSSAGAQVTAAMSNSTSSGAHTVIKSVNLGKTVLTPNNKTTRTITLPPSNQGITFSQQGKQRVFLPNPSNSTAQPTTLQIRPQNSSGSITLPASALPPGVLSNAQPGSLVMIPAQYFQNSTSVNNVIHMSNQSPSSITAAPLKPPPPKTLIDANGIKPRKPCNCTKSQCLKLYCDCFANGEFCNNCNCNNCYNNLTHEEDRQKAIKSCLERNPLAFRPKIGKGGNDAERRHNKGCNCKRSGCLKNYCECFEAKIPCSNMCKCVGCRNIDSGMPFERKRLLSDMCETKPLAIRARPIALASLPSPAKMSLSSSAKSVYCRINQEVVEATCHCLLAQAEKAEKDEMSDTQIELNVINEFSRCLLQIIGVNTKIKGPID